MPNIALSTIGVGAYSLYDASRLIRVPYQKLKRWAEGYWFTTSGEDTFSTALVPRDPDDIDERVVSFAELMEFFVIGFFRHQGVSMPVIRAARRRAASLLQSPFPFATQELETDGSGIFAEIKSEMLDEDVAPKTLMIELANGQMALREIVTPFMRDKLDFDKRVAFRYWPKGRDGAIILDARRSFGKPILELSGTPTFAVYEMAKAGEDPHRIASWYQIPEQDVAAAINYEEELRIAA